ncbi:hypothetical protein Vadar_012993 [Vaccinium darrowii]|uniref:Uncharacterized protein n=1 Tax=Vaccinium darrowii TaxID=229202 RepID=A0ACB7YX84_9ERIC|nr:hypothetical protein Vadar_012993 [Vaccinium darrowii]
MVEWEGRQHLFSGVNFTICFFAWEWFEACKGAASQEKYIAEKVSDVLQVLHLHRHLVCVDGNYSPQNQDAS